MPTVRPLTDPADPGWDVLALVYNSGNPMPDDSRTGDRYVMEIEGECVGTFTIIPMDLSFGEGTLRTAGIGAVGVVPHRRGNGVGQTLMAECVRECARQGYVLSTLYPFREPFYAKVGYASVGYRVGIEAPPDRIPAFKDELPSRMLSPDDWALLVDAQTAFARRYTGVPIRDERMWRRVVSESRPLRIYAFGDPVEAWAVVGHKTDFWSTDRVGDVGWTTPRGYRSMLAFLRRLGINKGAIQWEEPTDSPFLHSFLDYGITTKLYRTMQARVLAPLPVRGTGEAVVRLHDPQLPSLDGTWRMSPDGWERSDATPDAEVAVGPFTQGALGSPSFATIAAEGRMTGDLSPLWPPAICYHPDFY